MAEATKVEAKKETGEIIVSRVFAHPREKVFKAWASDEAIKQWWGPREWPTSVSKMDFRAGGTWHYAMQGPDGTKAWGIATYSEIKEPERIVYEDAFSDESGKVNRDMPVTTSTITFEDLGDGTTKVTSYSKYSDPADFQKLVEMGAVQGISETWDRLEEYLSA